MENRTLDRETWFLALSFEWQSIQKLVLQEGEKFVLYFMATLTDQGIYSVVNNLGKCDEREESEEDRDRGLGRGERE
jgi:hypothetical protein